MCTYIRDKKELKGSFWRYADTHGDGHGGGVEGTFESTHVHTHRHTTRTLTRTRAHTHTHTHKHKHTHTHISNHTYSNTYTHTHATVLTPENLLEALRKNMGGGKKMIKTQGEESQLGDGALLGTVVCVHAHVHTDRTHVRICV